MRSVQVILSEDVQSLGQAGELVNVKPGFAFNFLIPQGKAIAATEASKRELEHQRRVITEKVRRELEVLEVERKKIEGVVVEITAQAGEEGKLFGSVTTLQISEKLAEQGIDVDRRRIDLPEAIKTLGEHAVVVKLHRQLTATIKVKVVVAS
ncbi:MAG: 50S ribosomal protein L9 [Proteobacteria bacterium]|nr:50S ribosomal protein L9 [Pseudomonadota bacterium]